jgi:hypothetical protein
MTSSWWSSLPIIFGSQIGCLKKAQNKLLMSLSWNKLTGILQSLPHSKVLTSDMTTREISTDSTNASRSSSQIAAKMITRNVTRTLRNALSALITTSDPNKALGNKNKLLKM